jgi:hypothetical protein
MKKTFIVEIEYNELPENLEKNADVLYAEALEAFIEDMMYGYQETRSIIGNYEVNVVETTPLKVEFENKNDVVYATPHSYRNLKVGDSIWVSDKRLFDTDVKIKVSKGDILKFEEHNDMHDCNIYELTDRNNE